MWLFNSSIGKKVLMSVSGIFLILFLTFHACMNMVSLFSFEAYDAVCEFLGANWYALVGTLVLAGGFLIHMVVALILTNGNNKARGNDSYEINGTAPGIEWSSRYMGVLGVIILGILCVHMGMFWAKMQLVELFSLDHASCVIGTETVTVAPSKGAAFLLYWFQNPVVVVCYLLWLVAIWFHLTHGVWSAFHTLGANNNTWLCRWKTIANIYATIIVLMFASVVVYYCFVANSGCECVTEYLHSL